MLKSQTVRKAGPEVDPLWMGSGKTREDLSKPQILIDSTYGDSHPGSRHLMGVAESVKYAVYSAQAMPSVYTVTDICDGVATGHRGMDYSLISREMIAGMVEIHAMASGYDGLVTISSCDKATPGHLMAIGRLNIPAVHVAGGSMMAGPAFISADSCYETNLRVAEGNMTEEQQLYVQRNACPSCGACQYMGTASTMQAMAEVLGISLPSNAMIPANTNFITQLAAEAGNAVTRMVREDIRPSDIMTRAAFENAIKVHAAIGGSTNAALHLPSIAAELGISITHDDFDRLQKGIPLLTSVLTAGVWPTQYFWLAGGIPRIIRELREYLDLNVLTVTGRTMGENLEMLEHSGYFRRSEEYMANMRMRPEDIIRPVSDPVDADSGITILKGNIAPDGAIIKHCAVDKSMYVFTGRARVFETEEEAIDEIYRDIIQPGDVVVIRYKGIRAAGMPEMLKATDAICNKPKLCTSTALITDGRFSGASRGPCVGYLLPEAAEGGPIRLIEDGDLIEINVYEKSLNLVGVRGERLDAAEVRRVLDERAAVYVPREIKQKGVLKYFSVR